MHEIIHVAAEELTEPMIDLMQYMMPSWMTMVLVIMCWVVIFVV